ncbi:MAG: NAD(P)/FAD-dependent oxidoreductase [Anaerolineaceae bacterium]
MRIAIIGAGASGLIAALQAAWKGGEVTLFERNTAVGKKLLVTGSGRCNITNEAVTPERYTCQDPAWMAKLLSVFGLKELLAMLDRLCIPLYRTSDGWYYPLSNSAQTVVDVFFHEILSAGVTLRTSTQVTGIGTAGRGFKLEYKDPQCNGRGEFDRLIVSAGGRAYPALGSKGELFPALSVLGHTVLEKRPALAPVLLDLGEYKALHGLRFDVGVGLWDETQMLASSRGNMIFTEWGLNGPAVMDVSHAVSIRPGARLTLKVNFLAFFAEEFEKRMKQKRGASLPLRVFLEGFFPPKAAAFFCRVAGFMENKTMEAMTDEGLIRLTDVLQGTALGVRGVRGFEYCQVTAGGVPVGEVDPHTLQSRIVRNLYLTGETLDVVGPCGGYNLQFAFSSGAVAGIAAAMAE